MSPLPVVPAATSPCDGCISGCCRGLNLVIDAFDAWRLGRDTGRALPEFADLRWTDDPDEDYRVVLDGRPAEEAPRRYRLLLRREVDPEGVFERRCVFLVTEGGQGRCGVYASRPSMCRTYPTWLTTEGLRSEAGDFCPPGSWALETVDAPALELVIRFKRRQRLVSWRLMDRWTEMVLRNRERRSQQEFLAYVVIVLDLLEETVPAWFLPAAAGAPDFPAADLEAGVDRALASLGLDVSAPIGPLPAAQRPGGGVWRLTRPPK